MPPPDEGFSPVSTTPNPQTPTPSPETSAPGAAPRIVKRYSNRKLYDTVESRYVTLPQIAELVRQGQDVRIIDNNTKEDLTEVTLAQIIYEEKKANSRTVPLQTLKDLIHTRTEKFVSDLREGPIGRLIPKEPGAPSEPPPPVPEPEPEEDVTDKDQNKGLRATLEQWQHTIDERIRAVLPNFSAFRELQADVKRLNERLDELEKRTGGASVRKE